MGKLNARRVEATKARGLYFDGDNLALQITGTGHKAWTLLFMLHGRRRQMGLGSLRDVPLAEARDAAHAARKLVKAGVDPIEQRRATRGGKAGQL